MNRVLISLFLVFNLGVISQEIDNDFISSLPEGIQGDILKRAQEQSDEEEPVFRSIESQSKLNKKNIEELKARIEADLEYIERLLSEDENYKKDSNELQIFGSDFFSTYQSTFMPINEPNLSSDYILDFGDILEIQLVGQKEFIKKINIKRDGSISLPEIGNISLAGLSLDDAYNLIKFKVSEAFIGTEAYISLTNLRDINVLVSGNAYNPGIYTVSGNSNILHVLGIAGGINELGSYREINLIRDQKVIETLDMYDVLINGTYNPNVALRSGDIIFVRPVKNMVSIEGAVRKPAKYELNDDQNLSDVINYSDGLVIEADLSNIFLDRLLDGGVKSLPIRNISQFDNIIVNDGDKIFIRKHSFRSISINGAVLKPGTYVMTEGESLMDLVGKAGGFTKNAYPVGAVYENKNALEVNKMAKDALYLSFIDSIILASQKNPTFTDLSSVIEITEKLRNLEPNGRVGIDLLENSDSIIIQHEDSLVIPEKPNHVYIYGEVSNEGAISYEDIESVDYYISKSGGLKNTADKQAIYVLHPNGSTQRYTKQKNVFQNKPDQDILIYPGSVIFVPREIDSSVSNRVAAQAYASILGSIGITLASLSSINNN
tara:strand:- start:8099 stop:9910 length:1812 start_codon:yes stop_codon:yes gene_type:complete